MGDGLDELVTSTRFNEIHNARERVMETQQVISQAEVMGQISEEKATRLYRRMVENYIIELEDLMRESDTENLDEDYWESSDLGSVTLPDGDRRQIVGLKSILELPDVLTITYKKEVEQPRGGRMKEPVTEGVQLPRRVLRNAFRECNHFCADIGLELDVRPAEEAEFDYSDIERLQDRFNNASS